VTASEKDGTGNSEIEAARSERFETRRATVSALEEILFSKIPVLDRGFIRVVDYMGDDAAIVQAARVSYGRGTRKVSEDRGLIRYLMRHQHTTPFEMPVIKLHVKLPIFVARQWIRHRTASVNEYSARYSVLDREFYIPDSSNLATQSKTNRQGRSDVIEADQAAQVIEILRADAQRNYDHYLWLLNENDAGEPMDKNRVGIARELARMNLTLNAYTQWYWKIDLHNLMNFLRLRADSHAQYEIRVYADAILSIVQRWVPLSYDAFQEYRREAVTLSGTAIEIVRLLIAGKDAAPLIATLSAREWSEIRGSLDMRSKID
jgi:thymidylate synthase (FAD)